VARTKRIDIAARLARQPRGGGDSSVAGQLEAVPDRGDDSEEAEWDRKFRQSQFDWAVAQIRNEFQEWTWQAFLRTMGGSSAQVVATELGMSVGAVYTARSRVMARLRKEIERAGFDGNDA
jgi:RNA polymerase sigma-70 factor (ECF subfamily)